MYIVTCIYLLPICIRRFSSLIFATRLPDPMSIIRAHAIAIAQVSASGGVIRAEIRSMVKNTHRVISTAMWPLMVLFIGANPPRKR